MCVIIGEGCGMELISNLRWYILEQIVGGDPVSDNLCSECGGSVSQIADVDYKGDYVILTLECDKCSETQRVEKIFISELPDAGKIISEIMGT